MLDRFPGKGGWTYVSIPPKLAPPVTRAWARTPVRARVNQQEWDTSVWRSKGGGAMLPVPKKIRGELSEGARVRVEFTYDPED